MSALTRVFYFNITTVRDVIWGEILGAILVTELGHPHPIFTPTKSVFVIAERIFFITFCYASIDHAVFALTGINGFSVATQGVVVIAKLLGTIGVTVLFYPATFYAKLDCPTLGALYSGVVTTIITAITAIAAVTTIAGTAVGLRLRGIRNIIGP